MQPAATGLPPKYLGVSDPIKQRQIDEAMARLNAYLRAAQAGSRTRVEPTAAEQKLALSYPSEMISPKYTAAVKARSTAAAGLHARLQQQSFYIAPGNDRILVPRRD